MALSVPRYTIKDLDAFPEDGQRYELLDGMLLVTPAPRPVHQIVATRLAVRLCDPLVTRGHAHVVGPGAIARMPRTQLQPDLLVYPARFAPGVDWTGITEHWLAVEVLSRSSRRHDRGVKLDAYFALGVGQVWLVDIAQCAVEVWRSPRNSETVRDVIRWRTPEPGVDVSINLAEIFAGIDCRQ